MKTENVVTDVRKWTDVAEEVCPSSHLIAFTFSVKLKAMPSSEIPDRKGNVKVLKRKKV